MAKPIGTMIISALLASSCLAGGGSVNGNANSSSSGVSSVQTASGGYATGGSAHPSSGGALPGGASSGGTATQTASGGYATGGSAPQAKVIDFTALPERLTTNLDHFLVAGYVLGGGPTISLNGTPLPASALGPRNTFAISVPLSQGDNVLALATESDASADAVASTKTVTYDPSYSTANLKLVYVSVVGGGSTGSLSSPEVNGTVVIDPENDAVLGVIEGKQIVGISPDGREIYVSDRSVYSTATHQPLRKLALSHDLTTDGFLVSPDGTTLYSASSASVLTERLDVASNTLLAPLPFNIQIGSGYDGAPAAGGPAISPDGKTIYCRTNDVLAINVDPESDGGFGTSVAAGFGGGYYLSDLTVSPDGKTLLLSYYAAGGGTFPYNAETLQPLVDTMPGIGDFMGEASFLPNGNIVASSDGNPDQGGGRIVLIDGTTMVALSQIGLPMADNNAVSKNGDIFVAAGDAFSVPPNTGLLMLRAPANELIYVKQFALGVNAWVGTIGYPRFDQIRKIVIKE